MKYLDDIIISVEINKIKPNKNFYEFIINKYSIKSHELLFIDDNKDNVDSAKDMDVVTIKVNKETNILNEIDLIIKK